MTLNQMQQVLGLSQVPACFDDFYAQIADSWEAHAARILSESYISETLTASYALASYRDTVLKAAAQVRENRALCLLVCLLEQWIRRGGSPNDPEYAPPAGEGLAYDFLHLFPAIPTMAESVAHLRGRGVPEEVIAATLGEYDFCVNMCASRMGRPAFDRGRLNWITRVIHNRLIRIGRFKYDLPAPYLKGVRVYRNRAGQVAVLAHDVWVHRSGRLLGSVGHTDKEGSYQAKIQETEDAFTGHRAAGPLVEPTLTVLPKTEWTLCLSETDAVPRIHIPSDGSFDRDTVEASYRQAREIFHRCYPDYPYKAFFCTSWLMSPELRQLLKPSSNILAFQDGFTQIPWQSSGRLIFSFVFGMNAAIPENLDALPENTSLQRAVKALYRKGGYVHEGAGFFF